MKSWRRHGIGGVTPTIRDVCVADVHFLMRKYVLAFIGAQAGTRDIFARHARVA